jgi:hypothetical protein
MYASSEIQIHDPSVREGEGGSCFRPRGHGDWLMKFSYLIYIYIYIYINTVNIMKYLS